MLRIAFCVCIALILSGCQKNWRGFVVEKRIYRDGYYVHIPWKRTAPEQAYPKPEPYPVDHSRTASTDTSQKNAGGVAGSNSQQSNQSAVGQSQSGGTGGGVSSGGGGNSNQPTNGGTGGSGGTGNPSGASAVDANNPQGTNGTTDYPNPYSSPVPQPVPESPSPPLVRPSYSTDSPADSSIVADNPTPVDSGDGNGFDFPEGEFSLVAELGFYNPVYTSGIAIKPFSYNAGGALRYTIHPWARHKISAEGGVYASGLFIQQNQHKYYPMSESKHDKERILQFKSRFMLMDHIYITRKEDAKFDAIELGVFTDIGLFSTQVAVDYHGTDDRAELTRSKTRLFGLHYLRTMQCGLTARVANDVWSVFANYRFNSLVKAVPDGGDLPTLVVGATFSFGE